MPQKKPAPVSEAGFTINLVESAVRCTVTISIAGPGTVLEDVIDYVEGIADIHHPITIAVSHFERMRAMSTQENIIDLMNHVGDIDLPIVVIVTAHRFLSQHVVYRID
jgi:presenilin-like A22 family membrane protease